MITLSTTKKQIPIPTLVKVRDVAELLSVSRQTVHNLIDSQDLEASGINASGAKRSHLRVTRESLLRFYKKRFGHPLNHALTLPFES